MAKTILIIGGGAAGMMAACMAKEQDPDCTVSLFEKNTVLGAKVLISGGGRCNVTTGIFDVKELLKNYPRGAKFLMTALFRFPPQSVMAWFEERGVALKTEKDLRVFPQSDEGQDIVGALEKELRQKGVSIFCRTPIVQVMKQGEIFMITDQTGHQFSGDALILTTGGNAYRHTGSTGDGYAFAQSLSHTITPLGPSLNAFLIQEPWSHTLAGVSYTKAKLSLTAYDNQKIYERLGAFVFTHRGVSGPAIFALSSYAAYESISAAIPLRLTIDFFPDEPADALARHLLDLIQKNPQKNIANFLDILCPKSLCAVLLSILKPEPAMKAANLPRQIRQNLVQLLKAFTLTVIGRSGGEEFVTAGGVDTKEVSSSTMESKICPGLYLAGEILDIDGFTGGFNLQASWATGALAGEKAAL